MKEYIPDVKKILNWYNTLQASKGLVVTEEVTNAEVAEEAAEEAGKTKKVKKERITFF
jgi:hypothetical protein